MSRCITPITDMTPELLQNHHQKDPKILFYTEFDLIKPSELQIYYIKQGKSVCTSISYNPKKGSAEQLVAAKLVLLGIIDPAHYGNTATPEGCKKIFDDWVKSVFLQHRAVFIPENLKTENPAISVVSTQSPRFWQPSPNSPVTLDKTAPATPTTPLNSKKAPTTLFSAAVPIKPKTRSFCGFKF